ncbi:MAG: hypothetical protein ABI621_20295 [Chloroflexota bacterium]
MTLHCEYADAPTKEIGNDVVVMTGFSAGVVMGLIVYASTVFRATLSLG